jgi:hypothetical protein
MGYKSGSIFGYGSGRNERGQEGMKIEIEKKTNLAVKN